MGSYQLSMSIEIDRKRSSCFTMTQGLIYSTKKMPLKWFTSSCRNFPIPVDFIVEKDCSYISQTDLDFAWYFASVIMKSDWLRKGVLISNRLPLNRALARSFPDEPPNRPFSLGGHVESQENKKLCSCTPSLALNSRLGGACRVKTKLFILQRLDVGPHDRSIGGLHCRHVGGQNKENLLT